MTDTTIVYRHYDKDGNLMYVGQSMKVLYRQMQHASSSHWYDDVTKITLERFPDVSLAKIAERNAIRNEKPLHNRIYKAGPSALKVSKPGPVFTPPKFLDEGFLLKSQPGKYGDGNGLIFIKKDCGSGRWVWRYSFGERRRDMGLGAWPAVTLKMARAKRDHWEKIRGLDLDPVDFRKKQQAEMRTKETTE